MKKIKNVILALLLVSLAFVLGKRINDERNEMIADNKAIKKEMRILKDKLEEVKKGNAFFANQFKGRNLAVQVDELQTNVDVLKPLIKREAMRTTKKSTFLASE